MSLLQLSLDDIPINLVLFRFTKNSFSCIDANSLALLMIDIDFFKRINDNFGHDIGLTYHYSLFFFTHSPLNNKLLA